MDGGTSGTPRNIHQRLHAVMGEIDYIGKDGKATFDGGYKYVSHDKVVASVRPKLHKHGVIYYIVDMSREQDGNRTQCGITVCFANVDEPNDKIFVQSFGYGVDKGDKGPGKAMSYAVKYALLKTLGLETGDDPDHDQGTDSNYVPTGKPEIPYARSKKGLELLKPLMLDQKSPAELTKWVFEHEKEIGQLEKGQMWGFFSEIIQRGIDMCDKKIAVDLFWSNHETRLNRYKKFDQYAYEALEEYMLNKVAKLLGGTLEIINAG